MPTTLTNLVKNVDPPVEITQEEYDNLTTEQKNDGTTYYIVDGSSSHQTAATTPAEASNGSSSNVQAELDKKLEKDRLINGGTTTEAGYALDARFGKTLNDNVQRLSKYIDHHYTTMDAIIAAVANTGGVHVFTIPPDLAQILGNNGATAICLAKYIESPYTGNRIDFFLVWGASQKIVSGYIVIDTKEVVGGGPMFKTKSYSYTYSMAANADLNITANDVNMTRPDGYSPMFLRHCTTGNTSVLVRNFNVASTGAGVVFSLHNISNAAVSNASLNFTVAYVRSYEFENT